MSEPTIIQLYSGNLDNIGMGGISTWIKFAIKSYQVAFGTKIKFFGITDREHRYGSDVDKVIGLPPTHLKIRGLLNVTFVLYSFMKLPFLGVNNSSTIIFVHRAEHVLPFLLLRRTKLVLVIHGSFSHSQQYFGSNWKVRLFNLFEKIALQRINALILVNSKAVREYKERYFSLRAPLYLVPSHVDTEVFYSEKPDVTCHEKQYSFMYHGRIEKEKGVERLLTVYREISNNVTATLHIVGDGLLRKSLEEQVRSDPILGSSVIFYGTKTHDEIRGLLNLVDASCLFSDFEGSPFQVLESLASGTPVISFDVGDIRETVTSLSGLVLDREESDKEIAEKIVAWLQNTSFDERHKAATAAVRDRGIYSFATKLQDIIEGVYQGNTEQTSIRG